MIKLVVLLAALLVLSGGCKKSKELPGEGPAVTRPSVPEQQPTPTLAEPQPKQQAKPSQPTPAEKLEKTESPAQQLPAAQQPGNPEQEPRLRPNPLRGGAEPPLRPNAATPEETESPTEQEAAGTASKDSIAMVNTSAVSGRSGKAVLPKHRPFDPIKENGPIFVGWPRPKFILVLSGRQDGYLEPCGCAGLDRMRGGLSRRFSMFKQLRETWQCPVVGLDVGGLIKGFGKQAELKFQLTVEAMRQMGYAAIAFGKSDLHLPAGELLSVAANVEGQETLFASANVALFGFDAELTAQYKIVDLPGVKLGVTSVLGDGWQAGINNPEVEFAPAEQKLTEILPKLQQQADLLVLLAHADLEESRRLAERFSQFDIVVTAGGPPLPPAEPQYIGDGKRLFVEVGTKGMDVIVLGFYDDPAHPIRYQRVPLDSRFPNAPEVMRLMASYQEQLKQLGLEGLGIRPAPNPWADLQGRFVGSKKCANCHEISYKIWKNTGHAHSWQTLKDAKPPRIYDPECISCHVTGWHPTEYFPYEGGFTSEAETPHLAEVGCEACHGPGEKHIEAEMGADAELQEKLYQAMRLTLEEAKKDFCVRCHDLDNSPDFNFDTYWPLVEHYETE